MKLGRIALFLFFVVLVSLPLSGETWYIRHDGGTRYSTKTHTGQCDGRADAPYQGNKSALRVQRLPISLG